MRHALATGGIHAHVQRTVEAEAEPARGVIDLGRTDAQVHQHTGRTACRQFRQVAKTLVADGKPRITQPACLGNGLGVFVKRNQAGLRPQPLQDAARVPAPAERGVHEGTCCCVRTVEKGVNRLIQQNGGMEPRVFHGQPSEGKVLEDIGHGALHGFRFLGVVGGLVPQLEVGAHAQQHGFLGYTGGFAQLG